MHSELERLRAENALLRDALRLAKEAAAEAIAAGRRLERLLMDKGE